MYPEASHPRWCPHSECHPLQVGIAEPWACSGWFPAVEDAKTHRLCVRMDGQAHQILLDGQEAAHLTTLLKSIREDE
jgi:hypothetical protein